MYQPSASACSTAGWIIVWKLPANQPVGWCSPVRMRTGLGFAVRNLTRRTVSGDTDAVIPNLSRTFTV